MQEIVLIFIQKQAVIFRIFYSRNCNFYKAFACDFLKISPLKVIYSLRTFKGSKLKKRKRIKISILDS